MVGSRSFQGESLALEGLSLETYSEEGIITSRIFPSKIRFTLTKFLNVILPGIGVSSY